MGRVLLLAAAAAVVFGGDPVANNWEPQNDDEKLLKFRIKPMKSYVSSALIVGSATGLQMVTPGWVASVGGGETLQKCAGWLVGMRKDHPLAMVSAHGLLTKGCADLLAQTIPNGAAPAVWIDQLRLVRSTLASLISTSLPFYYWTKVMARWFRNYKTTVLSSGVVGSKILSSTFVTSLVKTTVTQALFRPINVFLFLALQSIFRGDSARQLVDTIKKKFKLIFQKALGKGIGIFSLKVKKTSVERQLLLLFLLELLQGLLLLLTLLPQIILLRKRYSEKKQ